MIDDPVAFDDGEEEELFQATAMVDVVFILLAFFVMTASFLVGERELGVGRDDPVVAGAAAAAEDDLPRRIVVRLDPGPGATTRLRLGGRALPDDGFAELTAALEQLDLPDLPIVIAPEARVPIAAIGRAMDAALASPMNRIALAPAREPEP